MVSFLAQNLLKKNSTSKVFCHYWRTVLIYRETQEKRNVKRWRVPCEQRFPFGMALSIYHLRDCQAT